MTGMPGADVQTSRNFLSELACSIIDGFPAHVLLRMAEAEFMSSKFQKWKVAATPLYVNSNSTTRLPRTFAMNCNQTRRGE
jgi:hypothetical protein